MHTDLHHRNSFGADGQIWMEFAADRLANCRNCTVKRSPGPAPHRWEAGRLKKPAFRRDFDPVTAPFGMLRSEETHWELTEEDCTLNTLLANWETEVLVTAEAPFGIGVPLVVDQDEESSGAESGD